MSADDATWPVSGVPGFKWAIMPNNVLVILDELGRGTHVEAKGRAGLIEDIAKKYRKHNATAIEIGGIISELGHAYNMKLPEIRQELHEEHGILVHSGGTLSKWRSLHETYIQKWGMSIDDVQEYDWTKLYIIKDVFDPSTKEDWFQSVSSMTQDELMLEVSEPTAEQRKHYSLPISVATSVEEARKAWSADITGDENRWSFTVFMEITAQLIKEMTPAHRKEIYDVLHGEKDEQ